nr:HlyD family efflux transporter periplasmic adaptor subunit [Sedimentibacter sp.]
MQILKNKKVKLIAIVCAVFLVIFMGYRFTNKNAAVKDTMASSEVEHTVSKDNINVSVTGSGSVNPTDKRVIKSEEDGTVNSIYVSEGDLIEKDQILISLKSDSSNDNQIQSKDIKLNIERAQKQLNDLYASKGDLNIYADESGVISNMKLEVGDQITANSTIGTISDTDNSYIEVYFTKDQFDKIKLDDPASVFMTKYFSTVTGVVSYKDSTPVQKGGGTFGYKVNVKIKNPGGYSVGDVAQVSITNSGGTYQGMYNGEIIEIKEESIISKIGGKVKTVKVENGEYINKGDIVATMESDDIELQIAEQQNIIEKNQSQLNDLTEGDTVYSPMKGTVLQVDVSGEEVVDRNTVLMTVADLENMEVVLDVDELDITKITLGQQAIITTDVFKDESFTGKVTKISMEGQTNNGVTTYKVTIHLDDRKSLMSGMNVDIEILSDERNNVIVVPIDAIHKLDGEYMVTIKDKEGNKSDVKVELGLANKDNVEIVNGVEEGDVVVYDKIQVDSTNPFEGGGGVMRVSPGARGGQ